MACECQANLVHEHAFLTVSHKKHLVKLRKANESLSRVLRCQERQPFLPRVHLQPFIDDLLDVFLSSVKTRHVGDSVGWTDANSESFARGKGDDVYGTTGVNQGLNHLFGGLPGSYLESQLFLGERRV